MARLTRIGESARAPRLRRIAELIDDRAEHSRSPAKARAVACAMRVRAGELEAGIQLSESEELARLLSETVGVDVDEVALEQEDLAARLARHRRLLAPVRDAAQ